MAAGYETVVFHDANQTRLHELAESVADELHGMHGWKRRGGDLPGSVGLHTTKHRITIAIEEKSVRIVSESKRALPLYDWGWNRKNVDKVRRSFRKLIQDVAPHSA